MVVNPDCPKLKFLARTHGLEDIFRPYGRGKTIYDTVGFLKHLFLSIEAADDDDGAKDFTLYYLRIVVVLCDNGWFEEEAFFEASNGNAFATSDDIGTVAQRTRDTPLPSCPLSGRE